MENTDIIIVYVAHFVCFRYVSWFIVIFLTQAYFFNNIVDNMFKNKCKNHVIITIPNCITCGNNLNVMILLDDINWRPDSQFCCL